MKYRMSAVVLGVLFAGAAAAQAVQSGAWLPVDQDVWTILLEEPQAHLLRAQEDLSDKDVKGAADEIRRAGAFLKIQERRLAVSSKQLSRLANDIESGKAVSVKEMEDTSSMAVSVLDHHQPLMPVMTGSNALYMDEADYHLAQAQRLLDKKDGKSAAADIRKAAAYLRLKAVYAGEKLKGEIAAAAAELQELARQLEVGGGAATKDLERVFARARKAVRRVV